MAVILSPRGNEASYISRTRMDSQKEEEEPQDDDTISDYALSYLMDGMEE